MACMLVQQGGQPRAVGAVRLSRYTDASTSPEVQTDTVTQAGQSIGARFVGWARDTDVSAIKTTPWEREELSYWLDRPDEWDVMIWQRMDRAVRSMADMADLGRYAKKHRKRLIFASGPGGDVLELDFTSIMSEFMMMFLAFAAQLEGQTIMERNQGAAAYLQQIGRWGGGSVPYGFRPVRKMFPDGNEGWWLATDEGKPGESGTAQIRREMVTMAIKGATYSKIRDHLNNTNAITPKNYRAALASPAREFDPDDRWHVETVRKMLRSPMMRGHLVKADGTPVLTATGEPVRQGESLISDQQWYDLQEEMKKRGNGASGVSKRKDAHPLLGVLVCDLCGNNMARHFYKERRNIKRKGERIEQFRCTGEGHALDEATGKRVPGISLLAEPVMKYVEAEFLKRFGNLRRTMTVTVGGVDNRAAIAELRSGIANLGSSLANLRGAAAEIVTGQLNGMSERLAALEETPYQPPRREVIELPDTWGEDWRKGDAQARREMLLSAGVRVTACRATAWHQPVSERVAFEAGHFGDPAAAELNAIAQDELE
ncbi:recombinase family protein [Streptomyces sp. 8N616]|uniref:recombinase family protein n=1 Tax=Streptomyces sp. 8N616 TaxID=3457414 RepID=UPI003FD37921